MDLGFRMHAERTPNPNSIKWVLSCPVADGVMSAQFDVPPLPETSPLASALFNVAGIEKVFLGPKFVTVTKAEGPEWTDLAQPIVAAIKDWAAAGSPALGDAYEAPAGAQDSEVVKRIVQILEDEIRPYVAQDGGEISFAGFHDGVVEVVLQGACAGCPSSTVTLKMGIESRLKEEIPEVTSVVSV